jgi:hypothetical protein
VPLFSKDDLEHWLRYDVEEAGYTIVEKVVTGWVFQATGWTAVPDPLPSPVFSWALELGGIGYENPTSQADDQTDLVRSSWRDRRSQILAELRAWAQSNGTAAGAIPLPRGSFPRPCSFPDPAYPYGLRS